MQKIIGVTELQHRIAYILTRGSQPEAVIISYEDYVRFQELQEQASLAHFDRLLNRMATENAQFGDEEVAADMEIAANVVVFE